MSGDFASSSSWAKHTADLLESAKYFEAANFVQANFSLLNDLPTGFLKKLFEAAEDHPEDQNIRNIVTCVASNCPLDDVVFELIDASSNNDSLNVFILTLDTFEVIFSRDQREMHLDWSLSFVRASVSRISSLDGTADKLSAKLFNFLSYIWRSFSPKSRNVEFIILATALSFTDSRYPEILRTDSYQVLLKLAFDPCYLMNVFRVKDSKRKIPSDYRNLVNDQLIGLYFYHIFFSHNLSYPQVYSSSFMFSSIVPLVDALMQEGNVDTTLKGMELLDKVTFPCQGELSHFYLIFSIHSILKKLNHLMVYDEEENMRKKAFAMFESLINCFSGKAQYLLMLRYRADITHPGTLAYFISKIKKQFDNSKNAIYGEYFAGKRFFDILKAYCFIEDMKNYNLVENAEPIIASLNFFYYLLICKNSSELDFHGFCPQFKNEYLEPLSDLVNQAKDNCNKQLFELERGETVNELDIQLNLSLPELSMEEKVQSVLCARNAIEMVELNLNRIFDILHNN